MKTLPFKKIFTAVLFAGAVMAAPLSHATIPATINSLFTVPGINQIEDTDADRIFGTRDGVFRQLVGTDTLQTGDTIQSILRFTNVNGNVISDNPGFSAPYGLLAYSELVLNFDAAASVTNGTDTWTVTPNTATLSGGPTGGLGALAGTLVNLYEQTVGAPLGGLFSDAPNTGIATVIVPANFIASFGLGSEAADDDFWQVRTPTGTLSNIFNAAPGSGQAGLYEFGLSTLLNPGLMPIAHEGIESDATAAPHSAPPATLHDVVGDGSGFGLSPGTNPGWDLSSNTTVAFNTVPEPELLVLLSVGLLAGRLAARRRSV